MTESKACRRPTTAAKREEKEKKEKRKNNEKPKGVGWFILFPMFVSRSHVDSIKQVHVKQLYLSDTLIIVCCVGVRDCRY